MIYQTPIRQLSSIAVFLCIMLSLTACSQEAVQETVVDGNAGEPIRNKITKQLNRVQPRLLSKRYKTRPLSKKSTSTSPSNRSNDLTASISGDWDDVTGWISFPYDDGSGELSVLARGLEGIKQTGDEYSFSGWDGDVFWIDMGDGVPRLLPAQLRNSTFVPLATDAFTQSGKLYKAGYVLYRQAGVSYPVNEWVNGAVFGDLLFVTDANDQVLEIVVDVYNDLNEFIESRTLAAGDQLQMLTHAYDLTDPETIYLYEYMDYKQLSGQPAIEKAHYLPNVDFSDTDLLDRTGGEFDASTLKLELLVDAIGVDDQGKAKFAFNTPKALGYTWGEAKQALSTNTTSSGGGAFAWILLFIAGLGGVRFITRRKKLFTTLN